MASQNPEAPRRSGRREGPRTSSSVALWVLVGLAIAAPWPFGSVEPWTVRTIVVVALATTIGVAARQTVTGGLVLPMIPLWPAAGLAALAAFQLVPLPLFVHRIIAPGSHAVWHPANVIAAAVLGSGWRPISVHPQATLEWLAFFCGVGGLALLAAPAASDPRIATRACAVIATGGVALAVYGILARGLFGNLLYGSIDVPTIAPFGPFVSKNHFAGYVEMAALLTAGLAFGLADRYRVGAGDLSWTQGPRAGRVLVAFAAAAAMALGVLVSLSRGGIVSLGVGLLALITVRVAVSHRRWRRQRVLVALLAAAFAVAVLLVILPGEARERIQTLGAPRGEASGSFRWETWRDCLRAAWASPLFGQGQGAFADILPRFKSGWGEFRIEHAENDYVELLVESALFGLGLVVLLVVKGARAVIAGLRIPPDRLVRGVGTGALAALAALAMHSMFDFNLHIPSNAVLAAIACAFAAAAASSNRKQAAVGRSRGALVALLAVGVAFMLFDTADDAARDAFRDSVRASVSPGGPLSPRLQHADHLSRLAVLRRPADASAWLLVAWTTGVAGSRQDAAELAAHALALDPGNRELSAEAARLVKSFR